MELQRGAWHWAKLSSTPRLEPAINKANMDPLHWTPHGKLNDVCVLVAPRGVHMFPPMSF